MRKILPNKCEGNLMVPDFSKRATDALGLMSHELLSMKLALYPAYALEIDS
ncbi:hypothetical protein CSKR_200075 [Clonorchis sinensis]|uniref:Uncharacterized protein n=1 Tax=Clonorchis sinensis TaxID=79923 RepID=A0A8T1LXL7_CLOSI|nr:hypothetical protein CSKR_200075 [Clonorchis sinensis]